MLKSIWRYSHLMLAVSSCLILSLLSITGIFLAFDPIIEQQKGFKTSNTSTIAISNLVPLLKEKYPSIASVNVNDYGMVVMQYTDTTDESAAVYIDPSTGEKLGPELQQTKLMEWMTNLHRSIFLKETGRAIVGITSFLLILISLSGILLLIQRQRGLKRFFAPAGDKGSAQYYHVVWGRVTLLLIIFIALSGTYLSYDRFFPEEPNLGLVVDTDNLPETPLVSIHKFNALKDITLDQVEKIQFPFSEFPEDYFQINLKDRHIAINQFTGEAIASYHISNQKQLHTWALDWHTGRSSIFWAIILGIGSGYIMFFIISGFIITFKRLRKTAKNRYKITEASHLILVGTENGSTKRYAETVFLQLIALKHKAFIGTLNDWTTFPNAQEVIIFTATYGDGEAPHSADKALELIQNTPQTNKINFSVLGFGSRQYPEFCGFAYLLDKVLNQQEWSNHTLHTYTVDDKSPSDFEVWMNAYNACKQTSLKLSPSLTKMPKRKLLEFTVTQKTPIDENETFTLCLSHNNKKIQSGDLLSIFPANDYRERLYSIGMINNEVQLCVKQQHGLGSSFLYNLKQGQHLKAGIISNKHFHLPASKEVVMICNGTGIAPFLGMIHHSKNQHLHLYCGFRTSNAFAAYRTFLDTQKDKNNLTNYHLALSREGTKTYVSDLIERDSKLIATVLQQNGSIMICGSMSMMRDVLIILEKIAQEHEINLEQCKMNNQILTDCY